MDSFLETLKELGPARLGIMGATIFVLLLFFVFISMRVTVPEMQLLYSDLSTVDSAAVAGHLEKNSIKFIITADGSKITVPEDQVGRARMLLAEAGLPNGGSLGYELFDESSGFGTTNFVQNINQVRALEGELARTITSLDGIRSTRVHIVLPQRELFSREQRNASASVFLGIRPGFQIAREKVRAIQSLVGSAVPDMQPDQVAIIDSNGKLLAAKESDDADLIAAKAEEMRLNHESRLIEKIEDQLSRVVGYGKVRATVTAEMNFDRISTNEELFDPAGQVLRSTQTTEETSTERDSQLEDVSVDNNLPNVGGDLLSETAPSSEGARIEEVSNFEISRTVRNTVREVGEVKRLSVAILVDGRYTRDEKGVKIYEARPQEELDQLEILVRGAIGYDEKRGDQLEIVNLQFASIDTNEEELLASKILGFEQDKLLDLVEILTIAIMIILVILLVLQPMVNRLLEIEPQNRDSLETELLGAPSVGGALPGPEASLDDASSIVTEEEDTLINVHGVEGKVKASSLRKVEEIVDNYPNETLAVIRSWMTQD